MFNFVRTRLVIAVFAGPFMLTGCGGSDDEPETIVSFSSDASILQYVPSDSPYVVASVEPLPDKVMDKLEPKFDRILTAYRGLANELVATLALKAAEDDGEEDLEKFTAVMNELSSLLSLEGLRDAGIERDSTAVFYGHGLLPVLRMQIADGDRFNAALTRIEEKAGEKMSVASLGGHSFRYMDADKAKVILATFGNQIVISIVPAQFDDDQLSQVLGLKPPAQNIADAGVLASIAKEYGYTNQYVGYVDLQSIVETFVGTPTGLNVDLLELMEHETPEISDVCRNEVRSLAGIAPRMVMGYKSITAEKLDSQAVIELREDIAKGLKTLPTDVPGLGGDGGGLMSFGMSMDIKAMRAFYEARLDAMEKDPFECEFLAEMQAGVAAGRDALNQPVPPMVYDFKGFVGVINEIEGLDLKNSTPPTSVDGRFLLAMDGAPALVSMGAMFSPELAGLNLEPNGEPVRLQVPQVEAMFEDVFVAMTDNALALSIGTGVEKELNGMLSADANDNGTFFSFSMDAGRYFAFIGEAIEMSEQNLEQNDEKDPMSPGFQAAMNDVMIAVSEFYDRMSVDMRFTDRGVEFDSSVTIRD